MGKSGNLCDVVLALTMFLQRIGAAERDSDVGGTGVPSVGDAE